MLERVVEAEEEMLGEGESDKVIFAEALSLAVVHEVGLRVPLCVAVPQVENEYVGEREVLVVGDPDIEFVAVGGPCAELDAELENVIDTETVTENVEEPLTELLELEVAQGDAAGVKDGLKDLEYVVLPL